MKGTKLTQHTHMTLFFAHYFLFKPDSLKWNILNHIHRFLFLFLFQFACVVAFEALSFNFLCLVFEYISTIFLVNKSHTFFSLIAVWLVRIVLQCWHRPHQKKWRNHILFTLHYFAIFHTKKTFTNNNDFYFKFFMNFILC